MIKSYKEEELLGPTRDLIIIISTNDDDIYHQVKLSDTQFDEIVRIINKSKFPRGFLVDVYDENFTFEPVTDIAED